MHKHRLVILIILLPLVTAFVCLLSSAIFNRVEIIRLGQGRYIIFYNDWYDTESCLRRFEIRRNLVVLEDSSIEFCDDPIQNEYKVVFAENGDLIGVLDYALDSPLIIMYDFKTDKCSGCNSSDVQADDLFKRLQKENPELKDTWR